LRQPSLAIALGTLLASAAAPALAQYENASRAAPPSHATTEDQAKQEQPAQKASGPQPSKKALKAIIDLQNAVKAKDTANIPAKVAAAQAVATTKEDHYLIARLQLEAAVAASDNAGISSAIDAISASGLAPQAEIGKLYKGLGGSFYNAKQYDEAIAAFNRAISINPTDFETMDLIAQSQFAAGHKVEAANAFMRSIKARTAAGQKAPEELYKNAVQLAYEAQSPTAPDLAREWVTAYPSPKAWHDSVAIYRALSHPDTEGTLDLLRLLSAAGALNTSGDYALFIEATADQNNYNEAQAIYDAGIAAKVINPADSNFRQISTVLKAKNKATAADLEAAVKMSPTPANLLRIGDRYYGMGNYAKAADIYRDVMNKPGADKELANLHLGMALARAGDKAGATAALNAVTGPRAGIAKYWLLYVQQHA
jgi:tetratricopeptide (TPR) repeat protein